jgi:hypothetical protein
MFSFVKTAISDKYFWIGFASCFVLFSHYIFGNDNALEQFGETIAYILTGLKLDFSPQ